jgi:ribose-phosphate pyrophosphokinase
MVDTGGTLVNSVEALKEAGAGKVFAACTHAVLSGKSVERIEGSKMEKLIVTNTIPLREDSQSSPKIALLSVASLFGEAVRRIHRGQSVSSLFA